MEVKELEKKIIELKTDIEALRVEKQRLLDMEEIKKVMCKYEYMHYPILFPEKIKEVFALDVPDVSMDVGDSGIFVGREGIETIFLKILGTARFAKGAFFMHCVTTPVIEVAGDGKTARAVFMSPGIETYYEDQRHTPPECYKEGQAKMEAYWAWGKYSADFIKLEDGSWKIWHLKWWRDFRNSFYKSWVDDAEMTDKNIGYMKRKDTKDMADLPFHKPMKFNQPYSQYERKVPLPMYPLPYETWDGNVDWPFRGFEDLIGKTEYDIEDRVW
ncbi:hypothetical protein CXIVA_25260 [Clostridium sp. SY8519]|uniref:nuclear transport factor 2 family protein n=1 Tax=Clostridium sp. (strain SY8519) TaxID=1042156 RepID=UPI00021722C0|nr:nuclear transport factor 2 family protein [Clostridium sp. SY8519]BAK48494.1 hypothetical protein CXIVA_25260 [Clostridium sp. SY8519]